MVEETHGSIVMKKTTGRNKATWRWRTLCRTSNDQKWRRKC